MKKFLLIVILLTLVVFNFSVGVQPLAKKIDLSPGTELSEDLIFDPEINDKNVSLELYKMVQKPNGEYNYVKANEEIFPEQNWVDFDETITIPAGQKTIAKINFDVPLNARPGTYNFIIMVTPETETASTGIGLVMRYAVRFTVEVSGIAYKNVSLSGITIAPDQNKHPTLIATVTNDSNFSVSTSVKAYIRNQSGKIIERLDLSSGYMNQNSRNSQTILKNTAVQFTSKSEYLISAGEYKINIFMNYDDKQRIFTSNINIPEGVFAFTSGDKLSLQVDKHLLSYNLYSGQSKTDVIQLENKSNMNSIVQAKLEDMRTTSKINSMIEWVSVRPDGSIKLPQGRQSRLVSSIRVPKETEDGAYYGKMVLNSFEEESKRFLTNEELLFEVLVGETTRNASITDIKYSSIEDIGNISFKINNIGDRYILPDADIRIENDNRERIGSYDIIPSDETRWLMPGEYDILIGDVDLLEPGRYFYNISLKHENNTIAVQDGVLEIEGETE
ncbi:MAG: hypothetical protein ACQESN_09885 [Thermotogota bacterium]